MKSKILCISLLVVIFSIPSICFSEKPTNKTIEEYDLQEKCGKRCEQYFKKVYDNGLYDNENFSGFLTYQNHYNKKLNKCFIIIENNGVKKSNQNLLREKSLLDVNENKRLGYFNIVGKSFVCNVLDKRCDSEQEWDKLVKPYMEE